MVNTLFVPSMVPEGVSKERGTAVPEAVEFTVTSPVDPEMVIFVPAMIEVTPEFVIVGDEPMTEKLEHDMPEEQEAVPVDTSPNLFHAVQYDKSPMVGMVEVPIEPVPALIVQVRLAVKS